MKKLLILIDADMFVFKACSSSEREIDWGNDVHTLHCNLNEAKGKFIDDTNYHIKNALYLMEYSGEVEALLCFSDPQHNFRKEIYPSYKQNRSSKRRPVCFKALLDYVKNTYESLEIPYLEADDCIGIKATDPNIDKDILIISGDKDMNSIPGKHYDFLQERYYTVDKDEADKFFYMQALTGDATDNYPGCPSIGEKTALKILDDDNSFNAVLKAYKKKNLSEEYALTQTRLARILRYDDYNHKKGKVKLWKPTTEA